MSLQIGIVGSGGMSSRRAENFHKLKGVEVHSVAARNPETGPALAHRVRATCTSNWEDLLTNSEIDALFVGTHNALHGPICIAALEAGKHVFCEYPTARLAPENRRLAELIASPDSPVFRLSNNESISAEHAALKERIAGLGPLFTSHFLRLTPGKGKRPDVLLNLDLTGPPALFFVYHIHTYVSLFGPANWVHATAHYEGLKDDKGYDRFTNTVTIGFASGGTGQWTWAGGIEVESAIQEAQIVTRDATLIEAADGWDISTQSDTSPLVFGDNERSLEALFLADVRDETDWRQDARIGLASAAIGHAAEISAREGRVVRMDEVI
ncbi:MAG: hypothetical protein CME19_00205 [Gemmatimonadetes bacterium]|nr:hypothetical protein [Gemmatimonadota bacterium]|tara:strand:- start:2174 stop:3148 length:975 start_codon:yes stop_codon:yes gene_type:complete